MRRLPNHSRHNFSHLEFRQATVGNAELILGSGAFRFETGNADSLTLLLILGGKTGKQVEYISEKH